MKNLPVMVVDDGNGKKYRDMFDNIREIGIPVIHHPVNKGKGAAIKTGIKEIIKSWPEAYGIITADCNGQYQVADILKIFALMQNNPQTLILGRRQFQTHTSFATIITRTIFKFFTGLNIIDTQTGLRGLPSCTFNSLLQLEGSSFDYEINMLLRLKNWGISYIETPINTIFIKNKASKQYHHIRDSLLILKQFLTMLGTSILSFGIDYLLFILFHIYSSFSVAICYILSRIISSLFNYFLNSKTVFKAGGITCFIRYYILAGFIMIIGSLGTQFLADFTDINTIICKFIVDLLLFMINYYMQKNYVFVLKTK